jgi:hypothetical protein
VHVDLSPNELDQLHMSLGMEESYAQILSAMDTAIKHGAENRTNDVVLTLTGRKPKPFRLIAEQSKSVWL